MFPLDHEGELSRDGGVFFLGVGVFFLGVGVFFFFCVLFLGGVVLRCVFDLKLYGRDCRGVFAFGGLCLT